MLRVIFIFIITGLTFFGFHKSMGLIPALLSSGSGLVISFLLVILEVRSQRLDASKVVSGLLGVILGAVLAYIVILILKPLNINIYIRTAVLMLGVYIGFTIFHFRGSEFQFMNLGIAGGRSVEGEGDKLYKILDTSAIIDGRISDIAETGFIDGIFVVPKFVLNELQSIADSSDSIKRQRGRRGLDILNKMQKSVKTIVQIVDRDFPDIKEVDSKLVRLGKVMKAKVLTTDFNLNKVSEIQGVKVLNINELSNALKPIVIPGEELSITIVKEGKDENQGIAYLDDGTMIVVDNGRDYLGKKIDVIVTSVLQTPAGRMIFAK